MVKWLGRVNWVCGSNGLWIKMGQLSCGLGLVELTHIFQTSFFFFFFFFHLQKQINDNLFEENE